MEAAVAEEREVESGNISSELTPKEVVLPDNWKDLIPEDIRKESVISSTKDITSMAKQLVNAQKMIGSRMKIPDNGDTTGWDEVYDKLGRPKDITGYKIERPESDNGVEYSEDREKEFLGIAHKVGLNNSQAQSLINWHQEQTKGEVAQRQVEAQEAAKTLQKEWGTAFKERVALAERIMNQFGDDASEAAVKDNPALIRLIYNLGKNMVEGNALGEGRGGTAIMTPKEALDEINKKYRDKSFMDAYMNKRNPTHDAAVEEIRKLNQMAYPEPEETPIL